MVPPKKKTKTLQQPVDAPVTAVSPPAQAAGPEVSLSALQQLEEKKKGIARQLKQVESQVSNTSSAGQMLITNPVDATTRHMQPLVAPTDADKPACCRYMTWRPDT